MSIWSIPKSAQTSDGVTITFPNGYKPPVGNYRLVNKDSFEQYSVHGFEAYLTYREAPDNYVLTQENDLWLQVYDSAGNRYFRQPDLVLHNDSDSHDSIRFSITGSLDSFASRWVINDWEEVLSYFGRAHVPKPFYWEFASGIYKFHITLFWRPEFTVDLNNTSAHPMPMHDSTAGAYVWHQSQPRVEVRPQGTWYISDSNVYTMRYYAKDKQEKITWSAHIRLPGW